MSIKNSKTPLGIEPATFRCVAQFLNELLYCVKSRLLVLLISTTKDDFRRKTEPVENVSAEVWRRFELWKGRAFRHLPYCV